MRICINYCKNCGAEYKYQASGTKHVLDIPKEYQDFEYCPECKKAIIEALSKIEKKTVIDWIKTDEITLEKLLEVEKNNLKIQNDFSKFPISIKVFPTLYNTQLGECSNSGELKYNSKTYHYFYFPSIKDEASITKKVRIDLKTNNIITDIF